MGEKLHLPIRPTSDRNLLPAVGKGGGRHFSAKPVSDELRVKAHRAPDAK